MEITIINHFKTGIKAKIVAIYESGYEEIHNNSWSSIEIDNSMLKKLEIYVQQL